MASPIFPVLVEAEAPPPVPTAPLEPVQNTAYVAQGLFRKLEQFKHKPRFGAWLSVYLEAVQEVEDVLFAILASRWIPNATGAQLDMLGRIVNMPRGNKGDDLYRVYIRAQIKVLRSSGTGPQLVDILRLILGTPFRLREAAPACVVIEARAPDAPVPDVLDIMSRAKTAGVRACLITSSSPTRVFTLSRVFDDPDYADTRIGFSSVNDATAGGLLATVTEG